MDTNVQKFDVIIVGGGHAGIEAAHAAARMGSNTALITLDTTKIGLMPCNPSIGGVGKGHIVYEMSALGGLMPKLCTKTYLQARMLNTKKGPAVQGLRLQIDKHAYNKLATETMHATPNLTVIAGKVETALLDENKNVRGVRLADNTEVVTQAVVLTTGTFLNGKIHIGEKNHAAGRRGEDSVTSLSEFLHSLDLKMGRLKTGTPPRLLRESIDFEKLEHQQADNLNFLFEFYPHKVNNTHDCYIARTNETTHTIIRDNLDKSAMYSGNIEGIGPRYCPSIEDKISRFADKSQHHIFVEPESATCNEVYPSGISTSLPEDVQQAYINSIKGFENAVITKPGYAVEYDFVAPDQLHHTLELKKVSGLFLAGQLNGTTGYEEAAGQGLVAGINAHQKVHNKEPFILDRNESYIGVMIDDLVTLGVDEPYRMFTSRAERRLVLRQDNAFLRLTRKGYDIGLVDEKMYQDFLHEKQLITQTLEHLRATFKPNKLLELIGSVSCNEQAIKEHAPVELSDRAVQTIFAELKYEPYLKREQKEIQKAQQYSKMLLPQGLDFTTMPGLSKELQEKLLRHKPATIAQATLIQGMTPAAISLLIFKAKEYTNR